MLHGYMSDGSAIDLPLFNWAALRTVYTKLNASERQISRHFNLKPHMARTVSELAGIGGCYE